jgi:hypothetical protein
MICLLQEVKTGSRAYQDWYRGLKLTPSPTSSAGVKKYMDAITFTPPHFFVARCVLN